MTTTPPPIERDRGQYGDGTASYPGDPGREDELPTWPAPPVIDRLLDEYRHTDHSRVVAPADLRALVGEVDQLRTVIREYVGEVESGEKFDALVCSVPGLVSDDGVYGAFEPGPVVGEWRASLGLAGGA